MKTIVWSSPVSIESVYDSRVATIEGEAVGEVARWKREDGDPWTYEANYESEDGPVALGEFSDCWDAMMAVEVALGVRPITHAEAWGLPGAARAARDADAAYFGPKK